MVAATDRYEPRPLPLPLVCPAATRCGASPMRPHNDLTRLSIVLSAALSMGMKQTLGADFVYQLSVGSASDGPSANMEGDAYLVAGRHYNKRWCAKGTVVTTLGICSFRLTLPLDFCPLVDYLRYLLADV